MDATIKDVARVAGVSISTVSNALNGSKRVSPEKQAAVMAAVRQLGYVPNINARLLKARRTGNIGLFLPYIDGPFFTSLIQEIYHACADFGYGMFTHVAREFDSQQTAATMLSCNIDAAIVLNDHLLDSEISMLCARGLPLVFKDRRICQCGVGSILLDNNATEQEVAYLAHTGHKRIAYLRGRNNHDGNERYEAFLRGMAAVQLPVDELLIMEGEFAYKVAYNCVYSLYQYPKPIMPDAILCANDEMALGCIAALTDMGYSVPRDVSVLGFDDMGAATCVPPLTTVSYSMRDFAHMAVEEAVRLIADPKSEGNCRILPSEMVLRKSVSFRYGDIPNIR